MNEAADIEATDPPGKLPVREFAPAFRLRGISVSRMEAFFDAAFAFAITLVVVSLQVPATFDELVNLLRGIPAFTVCFLLLWTVWHAHYTFCRRFGMEDTLTIMLNSVLVLVILIYVFPLKFLFQMAIEAMTGFGPISSLPLHVRCPGEKLDDVFIIYGAGFAIIWGLMSLLYLRAYRMRESLNLNAFEICETRYSMSRYLGHSVIGLISCIVAMIFANQEAVVLAGWTYALIGVLEFSLGLYFGQARESARANSTGPANPV